MLTLHYAPKTISVATVITLEAVGADYTAVRVDFASAEQTKDAYRAINPKGRVPALVTPEGILTETPAILEYIAPGLVPSDPFAAAKMRELMAYLNGTMHPHHAHKLRGERWADQESSFEDMRQKVPQRMGECSAYLSEVLPALPFASGDMLVASDPYLYVVLSWLEGDGVDIADFPVLAAFQQKMRAHPAVQMAHDKGMFG